MIKRMLYVFLVVLVFAIGGPAYGAVATFDDVPLSGAQYYNGSDGAGGFNSGEATFVNNYNSSWGSWDGWSVSKTTDTTTPGLTNQYSAYTGGAHSGENYGIFYETYLGLAPTIDFGGPVTLSSAWITNTTYAYLAVHDTKDGNTTPFVKEFSEGDWFKLTVSGFDAQGQQTNFLDIYLADYTDANPDNWYVLDAWKQFDLSALGTVYGLGFDLDSTDYSYGYMNTPAYFAMDDLDYNAMPIPGAIWLLGSGLVGLFGLKRRKQD